MGLRKGKAVRDIRRPYTRHSRVKSKSYIKTVPPKHITKFEMGNVKKKFTSHISLLSKDSVQIRDHALEAARIFVNRMLETKLGRNGFYFVIKAVPHQIIREHKMLTGAGADRMQSGMKLAFGKPTSLAAQVNVGKEIFSIDVPASGIEITKDALNRIRAKLPCRTSIIIERKGLDVEDEDDDFLGLDGESIELKAETEKETVAA